MAAAVSSATHEGILKQVYGEHQDIVPKAFRLQNDIKFGDSSEKLGDFFEEDILVADEAGITYLGTGTSVEDLGNSIAGSSKKARVTSSYTVLRSQFSTRIIKRADGADKGAFKSAMEVLITSMNRSLRKRNEIDFLYGQSNLGVIDEVTTGAGGTITLEAAQWAPGVWAGMEGAKIVVLDPGLAAYAEADDIDDSTFTIAEIDLDTRVLTVISTETITASAALDVVYFSGQIATGSPPTYKTMAGLHSILSKTSGTLFNIDVAQSVWKPSQYGVSGALTFEKTNKSLYGPISRGADEDMCLYINPTIWADLINIEVGKRQHDDPHRSRYDVGAEGITFHAATGTITIKASNYVQESYGYMFPKGSYRRIGTNDAERMPVNDNDDSYFLLTGSTGYETRMHSDQAIYSPEPGKGVVLTGITTT
jgi:hypothetical protein